MGTKEGKGRNGKGWNVLGKEISFDISEKGTRMKRSGGVLALKSWETRRDYTNGWAAVEKVCQMWGKLAGVDEELMKGLKRGPKHLRGSRKELRLGMDKKKRSGGESSVDM